MFTLCCYIQTIAHGIQVYALGDSIIVQPSALDRDSIEERFWLQSNVRSIFQPCEKFTFKTTAVNWFAIKIVQHTDR